MGILAAMLEWTFLGILVALVVLTALFFVWMMLQLVRNPSRRRG